MVLSASLGMAQTNLFDPTAVTPNSLINNGSNQYGGACGALGNYGGEYVSAPIPVVPGSMYLMRYGDGGIPDYGGVWLAADQTTCVGILQLPFPDGTTITAPTAAAFVRFEGQMSTVSGQSLTLVSTSSTGTGSTGTGNTGGGSTGSTTTTVTPTARVQYSPANNHVLAVIGDSESSVLRESWQSWLRTNTGVKIVLNDARPGRGLNTTWECYGGNSGSTLGPYQLISGICPYTGGTENGIGSTPGNTLAHTFAGVELIIIALGTNDEYYDIGTYGDPVNAGTVYGNLRWTVENAQAANTSAAILLITPQLNGLATPDKILAVVNAEKNYGRQMGIRVLDMYAEGGNNSFTSGVMTIDGTHEAPFGVEHQYGAAIINAVEHYFATAATK
jgi:hypothetical protein